MAEVALATLILPVNRDQYFASILGIANGLGLETETWRSGDPTRSEFYAVAIEAELRESLVVDTIRGGYLDLSGEQWLTLLARYRFNVERRQAVKGTCTVRLTNQSAAAYLDLQPGDITVKNSTTKATYRSTTGGDLAGGIGQTLDVEVEAEVAGSGGTSGTGEIDELVTALPNVDCTNTTAAIGTDQESDPALIERCRAKFASLSPAGPKAAYHYAATTPELNGGASVTRTRVVADSDTGEVQVYLANDSGAVTSEDRDLAEEAIETWANPLCIDCTVSAATPVVQAITYTLWVYDSIAQTNEEIEELIEDALIEEFKRIPVGGDIIPPATTGKLYQGRVIATILAAVAGHGFRVTLTVPAADVDLDPSEVLTLGTVTATINQVVR